MNHATTLLIVVSAVSLLACGPSDTAPPPAAETVVADGAQSTPELAPPVIEAPAVEPFTAEPNVAADAAEVEAAPQTPPAPVAAAPSTPAPAQPKATAPAAEPAASAPAADLAHGQQIYSQACAFCHDKGVAGAPKIGDAASWGPRLAQGMDALYTSSLRGKGAMPAKGGNPALSDGDVKAAVAYMVAQSR